MERQEQDGRVHRDRHLRERLRRLALWGPMGSGKTTVGQLLGRRHGVPVLDLDSVIDGDPVRDETAFRAAERAAFRARLSFDGVLSLGGGTLLDPESESLSWTFRLVVVLLPPKSAAFDRSIGKPLGHAADALFDLRERAYRRESRRVVRFGGEATPDDVADAVERILLRSP